MVEQPPIIVKDIYLRPGEIAFGKYNYRIRTLLGSCVALILWEPVHKLGGMSHIVLPTNPIGESSVDLPGKYADQAIQYFEKEIRKFNSKISKFQAKIFGGASMIESWSMKEFNIGERNIQSIKSLLNQKKIPIVAEHIGGTNHRKIFFTVWDGEVWLEN